MGMHHITQTALALVFASSAALSEEAKPPLPLAPSFVEETASSGIDSNYKGEWQFMVGGGVAAFDCNDDGFQDVLLPGGETPSKFYRNTSAKGSALSFKAETSGLEFDSVTGAYPLDVDSDDKQDVIILRVGENIAMRGLGACKFERANEAWNFDGGDAWSTALAATWERGAALPSIAIGNYIDRKEELSPWGSCTDNWLHRPDASQTKFATPLPITPSYCPLSMLFTDWNRSGTPSLRISNDREYYEGGQEQLWHVDAGKAPALYTEAEGWKRLRIWGMGIASADVNFDGLPDYFLTSMADHKLQTLVEGKAAQPNYADVAFPKGVTVHRPFMGEDLKPSTGWHAEFQDVNNDGLADLFVAKGNVAAMPDFAAKDPNNLLVQGIDGKFVEMADKAGVASTGQSRGGALVDFNLDGLVDLIVTNRNEPAQIWRNTTKNAGNFVALKLAQSAPNRDGIGAWIEVKHGDKIISREVTVGGGHAGGQIGWSHFGLGDTKSAELRVIWPDGTQDAWQAVDAGQRYIIERGKTAVNWGG